VNGTGVDADLRGHRSQDRHEHHGACLFGNLEPGVGARRHRVEQGWVHERGS
jgi:hypothetical protein